MHKDEPIFYMNLREIYNSLKSPLKKIYIFVSLYLSLYLPIYLCIYLPTYLPTYPSMPSIFLMKKKVYLMNFLKLSDKKYRKTYTG